MQMRRCQGRANTGRGDFLKIHFFKFCFQEFEDFTIGGHTEFMLRVSAARGSASQKQHREAIPTSSSKRYVT